ncbi:M48 family metallopeptidase [Methylobacter sp.]|uniref:M48 family metallopeptidase n=1 Tax=Methylobacter sp. TaxID=2051955 RepID=UPI003DA31628
MVVTPGKVEVVAPVKASPLRIEQFVLEKQQWIMQTLANMEAKSHLYSRRMPSDYKHGVNVPFQGKQYQLAVRPSTLKKVKIEFSDAFVAHVPDALVAREHGDDIRKALIRWMKTASKLHVEKFVNIHADKRQLFPRSIKIKTQKSRWGSCGIYNDININWVLIMAPPEVLEYVVVHELCHIQVKNHSRHFWALVAEHLPSYQQQRHWLKKHGSHLMMGL